MKTSKILMGAMLFAFGSLMLLSCGKTESAVENPAPPPPPSTYRIDMMVQDWERAKKFTMAYLDVANDKSIAYRLSDKTPRSFGNQLLHLAEANYGLVAAAAKKNSPVAFGSLTADGGPTSKADVTKAVMDSYDWVIATIKEMNDGQLADTCSIQLAPNFKPSMNKEQMLNKAFEHQTHHRGQATQYLRAQGLTPPEEMLF